VLSRGNYWSISFADVDLVANMFNSIIKTLARCRSGCNSLSGVLHPKKFVILRVRQVLMLTNKPSRGTGKLGFELRRLPGIGKLAFLIRRRLVILMRKPRKWRKIKRLRLRMKVIGTEVGTGRSLD